MTLIYTDPALLLAVEAMEAASAEGWRPGDLGYELVIAYRLQEDVVTVNGTRVHAAGIVAGLLRYGEQARQYLADLYAE